MPPFDWQLTIVLACVGAAALIVARRVWRIVRPAASEQSAGACGSCGGCGAPNTAANFVPVASLTAPRERRG